MPLHVLLVAGARPNFMKVAPLVRALRRASAQFDYTLVHTGQHYDQAMSDVFFADLGIPKPDVHLNVGSGTHAQQTAAVMMAFEPVLEEVNPGMVIVVGDVNSTIACALVASKRGIPVAHVEAGLRSYDRAMPEEINRVLTDQISDLLFTTEEAAATNLVREGVAEERIHFVGNVMIDTLLAHRVAARALDMPKRLALERGAYGVLTLHRPSNVDDVETFEGLMAGLKVIADDMPLVFPVHPRTRPVLEGSAVARGLVGAGRLRVLDPLGYLEFLGVVEAAGVVCTDSGGVQEETTVLGVPCLTLRENTERPVTVSEGTNQLVGRSPERLAAAWQRVRNREVSGKVPALWDGGAAQRILEVLERWGSRSVNARTG